MSKLKAYRFLGQDEVWPDANLGSDYYLKSEADKVIAELKKKLAEQEVLRAWAELQLRHNKYKRCLDKAAWCFEKSYSTALVKYDKELGDFRNFYDWWGNRWLELAEEFKPNKE